MRIREAFATMRGLSNMLLFMSPMILTFGLFGAVSAFRIYAIGPLEKFAYGYVVVPKLAGAGGTNLAVFLMCTVVVLTCFVGILLRYLQHRQTLEFLRSRGIHDFDGDGRIDSFEDKFLDDL